MNTAIELPTRTVELSTESPEETLNRLVALANSYGGAQSRPIEPTFEPTETASQHSILHYEPRDEPLSSMPAFGPVSDRLVAHSAKYPHSYEGMRRRESRIRGMGRRLGALGLNFIVAFPGVDTLLHFVSR